MTTSNNKPLVSIIVRTKDRPVLLNRALQSIAAQTYRPIEVVLVNDGGCEPDEAGTRNILGDLVLSYISLKTNTGRANAANVGLRKATGKFVCFLDDDDIYFPSGVENLVSAAREEANCVVYGKVLCRRYDGNNSFVITGEKTLALPFNKGRLILENYIPINAACIPRILFDKIGSLDTELDIYEDWDMLIRLAEAASFHYIDALIAEYSVIGSATISGKGGAGTQLSYREKVLSKHISKVTASDFLSYLQSVVDGLVTEKDGKLLELVYSLNEKGAAIESLGQRISSYDAVLRQHEEKSREAEALIERKKQEIYELERAVKVKDEKISEFERASKVKDEKISGLERASKALEEKISRAADRENELKMILERIFSSDSWKLTKPLRAVGLTVRSVISRFKREKELT